MLRRQMELVLSREANQSQPAPLLVDAAPSHRPREQLSRILRGEDLIEDRLDGPVLIKCHLVSDLYDKAARIDP